MTTSEMSAPRIAQSLVELVGNTPLLQFNAYAAAHGIPANIIGKLESFNPAGSAKDRIAYNMIASAERAGRIKPGDTIIEPTSGNTGIGLAAYGTAMGYKVIIVMPDTMSVERRKLIAQYGAQLVLTPGSEKMMGSIAKAEELQRQIPGSYIPQQFENPANPEIHRLATAEEIWRDTAGTVDAVVAGVGTGGTICGIAAALHAHNPEVACYAVQPAESPMLTGGEGGVHGIQGIMGGFVPKNYDSSIIDGVIDVTTEEAIDAARELARTEGVLVGISSGAALAGAEKLARRDGFAGKNIVAVLPDTGERYLSTALFSEE